jgi:hypothetical protein
MERLLFYKPLPPKREYILSEYYLQTWVPLLDIILILGTIGIPLLKCYLNPVNYESLYSNVILILGTMHLFTRMLS